MIAEIKPDLVVLKPRPIVIEVKTGYGWQDVVKAVGQSIAYAELIGGNDHVSKMVVVPADIAQEQLQFLRNVGLNVVTWRQKGSGYVFLGLGALILPRRKGHARVKAPPKPSTSQ